MSVENLLNAVSYEVGILKIARERYAKQLAPDFSSFNYIYTDEMMLSRIIADLLAPKGKHAQGNIFLKLFFEQFGLGQVWLDKELNDAKAVHVKVEAQTHLIERVQRRIDILLTFDLGASKYFLGVENKPFAADQFKQLEDYAAQLKEFSKGIQQSWHLIYLSGYGNTPSNSSVDEQTLKAWQDNQNFSQINYPDLVDWLKQCVAYCQNPKVIGFLNEFQSYILREFAGVKDMSEQDAIVDIVLKSQENIKAATEIFLAKDAIQDRLVGKLYLQLEQACKTKDWHINGELNRTNKARINILINGRQKIKFGIVLEANNYGSFAIGLSLTEENKDYYNADLWQKIYIIMVNKFSDEKVHGAGNKWWPFYINQNDIWNWQTQHQVWPMIESGDLCKRIMDYAKETYKALEEKGLLEQI